jgi:hypothetical protein
VNQSSAENKRHDSGGSRRAAGMRLFPAFSFRKIAISSLLLYGTTAAFFSSSALLQHQAAVNIFICCAMLLLMWLYIAGLRALQRDSGPVPLKIIAGVAALSGLLLLGMPPFDSTDMYAYIHTGWLQHYGLNPYISIGAEVPGWQSQQDFSIIYAYEPSIYGFLFTWICKTFCQLGHGSLLWTLLLFKSANFFAFGLSGTLLYALAKILKIARPHLSLYLFLWNPLILLEFIGNGHNDILMIMFLLLALYLVAMDRWLWVFPVLLCSVMIKFTSVILVPFVFLYCIKSRRLLPAVAGFVPACVILWLISAPYLPGLQHARLGGMSAQYTMTSGCVYQVVSEIYKMLAHLFPFMKGGLTGFEWLVREVLTAAYALFCVVAFYQAAEARQP